MIQYDFSCRGVEEEQKRANGLTVKSMQERKDVCDDEKPSELNK